MQFLSIAGLLLASTLASATYVPCTSTVYSNPLCCATDALGVIVLDCDVPNSLPNDPGHFRRICSDFGQQAKCCVLPIAGQALLCTNPAGF